MLCDKVKHRFDRKEGQQFAIRVHKIMRSTLFSFSWVELNNADLDIADQNGKVRRVRGVRGIHLALILLLSAQIFFGQSLSISMLFILCILRSCNRAIIHSMADSHSCFESLLARNNSVSLHQRNLQLLLVEIFKTKENLKDS